MPANPKSESAASITCAQLNPAIFLEAAQHVEGRTNNFACNAIKRASNAEFETKCKEMEFFRKHFLIGTDREGRDSAGNYVFGAVKNPDCREHRVLALLLCYAMLSNP
jgi:hypothetical protein